MLDAILYKGAETAPFAEAVMTEQAGIAPRSSQTVAIPLRVKLLRPLALLSSSEGFDLSQYCADLDLTVRKGSLKKRIQRERVPLSSLEQLFKSNPTTNEVQ